MTRDNVEAANGTKVQAATTMAEVLRIHPKMRAEH